MTPLSLSLSLSCRIIIKNKIKTRLKSYDKVGCQTEIKKRKKANSNKFQISIWKVEKRQEMKIKMKTCTKQAL